MKRLPAILALCLLALPLLGADGTKPPTAPAAAKRKIGKWEGFRGIKWGTKYDGSMNMILIRGNAPGFALYNRPDDKMFIWTAVLDKLRYGFYKGRFYAVYISCNGYENGDDLARAVFARYGRGNQPDASAYTYYWSPVLTPGNDMDDLLMSLKYENDSGDDKTTLFIIYMPIERQREADELKAALEREAVLQKRAHASGDDF